MGCKTFICVENPVNIGVSAYFEKQKMGKMWKRVESNVCPSMLRNIIGQIFDSKPCFFENLPASDRRSFWKTTKEKKRKIWTIFWLKQGQLLDRFLILQHICIYPAGLRGGPKTIKKSAAREPAKSCEGARSETRRPKRYKKRGLRTSQKVLKNMFFRCSGGQLMTQNGTRWRFSMRFGLPRFGDLVAERK